MAGPTTFVVWSRQLALLEELPNLHIKSSSDFLNGEQSQSTLA
jgi:hypothetical protein